MDRPTEFSPLHQPASIPVLRRLLAARSISEEEAKALEAEVRRELPWKICLDRGLLSLGAALILAGIVYFFAHNWNHLTDNDRLGLASGGVLFCLVAATVKGFDSFPGKILLLSASALVGVFIAVFGQIYQTGADNYELFAGWALLILPWVVLGRFVPLWLFWLGLLNFALALYWPVTFMPDPVTGHFRQETLSLFLLNGAALLLRELVDLRPPGWLDSGWSRPLLFLAMLVPASLGTVWEILNTWCYDSTEVVVWLVCPLYAGLVIALGLYYSYRRYSLPVLAILTLNACTALTVLAFRLITPHDWNSGILLIAGMIVLAIFGSGVAFLRFQRLSHQAS